jgi:chlorite dismutase
VRHMVKAAGLSWARMYGPEQDAVTFLGGDTGMWVVERLDAVVGEALPEVARLAIARGAAPDATWALRGVSGHARYVERREKTQLDAVALPLGRPEATRAALIPIRKSARWWALPQDERRAILEERSHHIASSLPYLSRIARRLYHARDLGGPFDFLTWFEYAPEHAAAFEELVAILRSREEWTFVEREVDVRLSR